MLELHRIAERLRQDRRLVLCDDYEIVVERLEERRILWRQGQAAGEAKEVRHWAAVRLVHRKQPGRAASASIREEALDALVADAFVAAEGSSVDPWFRFPLWRRPDRDKQGKNVAEEVPPFDVTQERPAYDALELPAEEVEEELVASERVLVLYRKSERYPLEDRVRFVTGRLRARHRAATAPGGVVCREESFPWESLPLRTKRLGELCVETLVAADSALFPEIGEAPVLVSAPAVAELLTVLARDFGADGSLARWIAEEEKLEDKPLFSPLLEMEDDGTSPSDLGGGRIDWEGSPTQKTLLLSGGVPVDHLRDAYAGARRNRRSTGSLLRKPGSLWPEVAAHRLTLRPGEARPAALRGMLNHGYLIQRLAPDANGGFLASGWTVSNGRLAEPFRDAPWRVTSADWLRRVRAVCADLRNFSRCSAPSILLGEVPMRS